MASADQTCQDKIFCLIINLKMYILVPGKSQRDQFILFFLAVYRKKTPQFKIFFFLFGIKFKIFLNKSLM